MKNAFLAFALALTMGCAVATMRPYVGEQQNWPTSQGSIVNTKYSLPVFTSLPPTPYDVVGELRIDSLFFAQPEEQHMSVLIDKAKPYKADALVLVDGRMFFGMNYGSRSGDSDALVPMTASAMSQINRFNPESFRPGVSVIAIRWLQGSPGGLPSKYSVSAKTYTPKPSTPKPVAVTPTAKPQAPKTNIAPAKPAATATNAPTATSPSTPKPKKKATPAKPDDAR